MILNMRDFLDRGIEYTHMTPTLWELVEFFNIDENWGDPNKVCIKLVFLMDALRKNIGMSIMLNEAYATGGHVPNSQHYLGRAADILAPGMNCWDLMWQAMRLPFSCVIAYPHWNRPGIHVDVRTMAYGKPQKLMWRDNNGKYWNIDSLEEFLHLMKVYRP